MNVFKQQGLEKMWCLYSTGENKRFLPIHKIHAVLGDSWSRIIIKAHVLTGDDSLSKVGTKHAALTCDPIKYLSGFAESDELFEADIGQTEEYLVKVWVGARSNTTCRTFSELRLQEYTSTKDAKALESLPPTSSSILGHIRRAHYVIRNVLCLVDKHRMGDQVEHGWLWDCGVLLPDQCLNPLPNVMTITCKCEGKCITKRCICRKLNQQCTIFCHQKKQNVCENK